MLEFETFSRMMTFILSDYEGKPRNEIDDIIKKTLSVTFQVPVESVDYQFNPVHHIDNMISSQEMIDYTVNLIRSNYNNNEDLLRQKIQSCVSIFTGIPADQIKVALLPSFDPSLTQGIREAAMNFDPNKPPVPKKKEIPDNVEELAKEQGVTVDHYIMEWC